MGSMMESNLKRYYFNIQETKSVLAKTLEDAEEALYNGDAALTDSDVMFVFATDSDGNEVTP
jgi:predicted solute-binding protein